MSSLQHEFEENNLPVIAREDAVPSVRRAAPPALPVFVTGLHKSGTTWLAKLLSWHPKIYVNYEAGFLDHEELLSSPRQVLQNQPDDESLEFGLRQLLERWGARPWNHWLDGLDRTAIELAALRGAVNAIAQAAVGQFKPAASFWLDKTPRTPIAQIWHCFPEARVIYLMRDARDRAISLYYHCLRTEPEVVEASEGLRRMAWEEAFQSWVRDIERNEPCFNHPSCRVVRYEDVMAEPTLVVGQLLEFLGVERDKPLLESMIENAAFDRLSGGRQPGQEDADSFFRKGIAGEWRNFQAAAKLKPFWTICVETAVRYRYDIEAP